MRYLLFLPALFFFLLPLIGALFSDTGKKGNKKLYDAEDKAGRYGSTSTNPKVVLKHIDNLESAISSYGSSASSATRHVCAETISELKSLYNGLIEDRWYKKASKYLYAMEADLYRLLEGDISNNDIENIRKIKNHALAQYDAYWKWTQECSDACDKQDEKQRLWDKARADFRFQFDTDCIDIGVTTWWGTSSNYSVREQIEKRLNQRLEELRPEYLRKKRLIKDILDTVAEEDTILRSDLAKMSFGGATKSEIYAMCKVLVKTGRLFEMKIDTRYIVSLSDKERAKREKKKKPPIEDSQVQPTTDA